MIQRSPPSPSGNVCRPTVGQLQGNQGSGIDVISIQQISVLAGALLLPSCSPTSFPPTPTSSEPMASTPLVSISVVLSFQGCCVNGSLRSTVLGSRVQPLPCSVVLQCRDVPWCSRSLVDEHLLLSSFCLLDIKMLSTFIYRFLCEQKSSFLRGKCPGMPS